jgi:hypothetical protein
MKIARIALLLLVAVCLGGLGYGLATYKRNAAQVQTLATPSTEAVDKPDFWEHSPDAEWISAERILQLLSPSTEERRATMQAIEDNWRPGYLANLVELFGTAGLQVPLIGEELIRGLEKKTGEGIGFDAQKWMTFAWNQDLELAPDYAEFKRLLYMRTDEQFADYFDENPATEIRWNEVVWGGVFKDGIPPLRNPAMIAAVDADYLADTDIVFGVEINGDVRAYPNRILAHHEMFTDSIGGVPVCGVY